jgi:Raf kinase inhibitor-like YbhB/YbcL family protein
MRRFLLLAALLSAVCAQTVAGGTRFAFRSPVFLPGGTIPRAYTCDGRDISPPLRWTAPPRRTSSFSLTVTDRDARGFLHWRVTAISARLRTLAAGARVGREGLNDFGRRGYGGPCPPSGSGRHRYVFALKALDARGRTLAVARLIGLYRRY